MELIWEGWQFECDIASDQVQMEDGGVHMVVYSVGAQDNSLCPIYVHLLSEDENPGPDSHAALRRLVGKRVRITIETAD